VQTADGKFSIEGEGFLWQQTNSSLFISNRVHTIVHPELLGQSSSNAPALASPKDARGVEIFSDQFDYAANSGLGVYRGNVRVAGTNLALTSGLLTVVLPMQEKKLQAIIAERKVIIDYEAVQATGERVTYAADTGLVHVQDHPTWREGQRTGGGDELIIDRTNKIFYANGHAWLKMPGQSMGDSGFLPRPTLASTNKVAATNQFVEIRSHNYEIRTNSAAFRDEVLVSEMADGQLKARMTCGLVTVTFAGTNELQQMIAQDKVVIEQEDAQFTAGRAVYSGSNGVLELTANPTWRAGPRDGKGNLLLVNVRSNEMNVLGNAYMHLPASEMGQSSLSAPGAPAKVNPDPGTNQFAEIFSDDYTVKQDFARFRKNVRVDHPKMKLACGDLSVTLASEGVSSRKMVAEKAVIFDLTNDKGKTVHGTGEKAVYTYTITPTGTNDLIVLTGDPVLETSEGHTFRNSIIILDHAKNKLVAPGKYHLQGLASAGSTNAFHWPARRAK
jgi:lipopolysaccharide export system protein LptA